MKAFSDGGSVDHVAFTQTADNVRIDTFETNSPLHDVTFLLHCNHLTPDS